MVIVFDLDGVLAPTDSLHTLAWMRTAVAFRMNFTEDAQKANRNASRKKSAERIFADNIDAFMEKKDHEYQNLINKSIRPIPRQKQGLIRLKKMGHTLIVASKSKNKEKVLDLLGIREVFDQVMYKWSDVDHVLIEYGKYIFLDDSEEYVGGAKNGYLVKFNEINWDKIEEIWKSQQ
jgi:beta-phosphoglucomutase-like phosphatase (HAD superfamily)